MFGYPIRNVFRSRWQAVIWAGFVLTTAYCTVPAAEHVAKHQAAKAHPAHANPWAKTIKKD